MSWRMSDASGWSFVGKNTMKSSSEVAKYDPFSYLINADPQSPISEFFCRRGRKTFDQEGISKYVYGLFGGSKG